MPHLLPFVRSSCEFDPSDSLVPFTAQGVLVGWMKPSFAEKLNEWPAMFSVRQRGVGMIGEYESPDHRSAALNEVIETLGNQGVIRGWRDEQVSIGESFYAPPLFHVERAASRYFGFTVYATHLNGLTTRNGEPHMWLAKRASTKHVDPGRWDNIVAGRIARGSTPIETLYKECAEEAGMDRALVAHARAAGAIRSKHAVEEGLHSEIVFVHDIDLPESFTPQNQDGEVEGFECVSMTNLLHRFENTSEWKNAFTTDAALVIIECLLRRGYFSSNRSDYLSLIHALRP
jgi:8-oxo-dGTP pyrophosphatase MutT (NUDIX family)